MKDNYEKLKDNYERCRKELLYCRSLLRNNDIKYCEQPGQERKKHSKKDHCAYTESNIREIFCDVDINQVSVFARYKRLIKPTNEEQYYFVSDKARKFFYFYEDGEKVIDIECSKLRDKTLSILQEQLRNKLNIGNYSDSEKQTIEKDITNIVKIIKNPSRFATEILKILL